MSRVTMIMPTFNRAKLIGISLESILGQSRPVDEIIVVNDGSTDETLQVLSSYGDRLKVISQANSGKAAAMNAGLAAATGDYLWFFDDDDIAASDGIAPLAAALDADPALDMAYGRHLKFNDDRIEETFAPEFWAQPGPDTPINDFLGNIYPFQAAMLVRRNMFDKVGLFNPDFIRAQDVEMLIRLALNGTGLYVPHLVFYQRGHSGARGVAGQQMTAQQALLKAVEYDQKGLLLHRADLTIEKVQPRYAAALAPDLRQRTAYLHRATMFARRALWQEAVADIEAANQSSATPALPEEIARCGTCIIKPQMWDILAQQPADIAAFKRLYGLSPYTKTIVTALARPLPWHIRAAFRGSSKATAWQRLALLRGIMGLGGAVALGMDKVLRKVS